MFKTGFLKDDFKMDIFEGYTPFKLLLISLVSAIFVIYPNIAFFSYEHTYLGAAKHTAHLLFFILRYLFFVILMWILFRQNLLKITTSSFRKRLILTFLITGIAYLFYICFSILLSPKPEWLSGVLLFQFFIMFIFCSLIGHVSHLNSEHRRKEKEIEQLKTENLQARYDALTNQINPHFFFNSLNGLTSLIRKKNDENALEYVNKMSDVFRYILQSDKKGLVTLGEELDFLKAFLYMMEIRFANKLIFNINVACENRNLKLPVLSLLPLIDNIVVHNTIDSEHKMDVIICLNQQMELSVSNPLFPKLSAPDTNGIGLNNLENRFSLLMNRKIRVSNDGARFTVYLPLKKDKDENTDS
jgi:sensor histidine kinase YesM